MRVDEGGGNMPDVPGGRPAFGATEPGVVVDGLYGSGWQPLFEFCEAEAGQMLGPPRVGPTCPTPLVDLRIPYAVGPPRGAAQAPGGQGSEGAATREEARARHRRLWAAVQAQPLVGGRHAHESHHPRHAEALEARPLRRRLEEVAARLGDELGLAQSGRAHGSGANFGAEVVGSDWDGSSRCLVTYCTGTTLALHAVVIH